MDVESAREEYRRLLKKSLDEVVEKLKGRASKIVLIGSYAEGREDLFTDLDLVVVMNTEKPFVERMEEIYSILALPVDADILCYTEEEYEKMLKKGFLKKSKKVVVYEKEGN